jgi:hypothetical protein
MTVRRESTRLVPNDLGRVFGHYGGTSAADEEEGSGVEGDV